MSKSETELLKGERNKVGITMFDSISYYEIIAAIEAAKQIDTSTAEMLESEVIGE